MIELGAAFEALNNAPNQQVVGVLEISFTNGVFIEGVNAIYIATHDISALKDGVTMTLPSPNNWFPFLNTKDISVIADAADDKSGVESIGSWSVKLLDISKELSNIFRLMDEAGFGLNRQVVEYYEYPLGGTFDDGLKLETKEISAMGKHKNTWSIKLSSGLEAANSPMMEMHEALLAADITAAATSLSITHMKGSGDVFFPYVPNKSLLQIGDEVMLVLAQPVLSADGLTLSFSSVQRHFLGTAAIPHALGDDVRENVRIQGNPIDIALMLLTGYVPSSIGNWSTPVKMNWYNISWLAPLPPGTFYRRVSGIGVPVVDTQPVSVQNEITYTFTNSYYAPIWIPAAPASRLPAHWHAGMDYTFQIDVKQWSTVQDSIAQQAVAVGDIEDAYDFHFTTTLNSAKVFVETEIMMLMSLRMYSRPDGRLGIYIKRDITTQPIADAPSLGNWRAAVLDDDTAKDFGELSALNRTTLMKSGTLRFGFFPRVGKGEAKRSISFSDSFAVAKHGSGKVWEIISRGLDPANTPAIRAAIVRLGRTVQRYIVPLRTITVQAMPMMMPYEVGDVLRVRTDAVDDYLTGKGLNRCFEVVSKSYNPFTRCPEFKLIAQTEQAKPVPDMRYRSPYANSAFLNGLADASIPANRNILALSPSGNPMTLTEGDWYIPVGEGNTYTMYGKWMIDASVRLWCSGELIQDQFGELDGYGRGGMVHGYAEAGEPGAPGEMTVYHEKGYWSYTKFVCRKKAATTHAMKTASWLANGYFEPSAFAFDVQSKTIVNALVTALKGLPTQYLGGARGGEGGAAIPTALFQGRGDTSSYIYVAVKSWALPNGLCQASYSGNQWHTYNYAGVAKPDPAGIGGAGFMSVARKQVWNGTVNLGGSAGAAAKETIIPKIDIPTAGCDDRIKIVATTGKSGSGSKGAFIAVSEADVFKGVHIQSANITAVFKEYLI